MKTSYLKTFSLLSVFILTFVACSSLTTSTYRASKVSHTTATVALKSWNDFLAVNNNVTVEQELKVQAAYDKYRLAQKALLNFAIFSSTNSAGVISTNNFDSVILHTSVALNELISLLTSYGVKMSPTD